MKANLSKWGRAPLLMGESWPNSHGGTPTTLQLRSVAQPCLTPRDPTDRSTPGFPVHRQLPDRARSNSCPSSQWCLPRFTCRKENSRAQQTQTWNRTVNPGCADKAQSVQKQTREPVQCAPRLGEGGGHGRVWNRLPGGQNTSTFLSHEHR